MYLAMHYRFFLFSLCKFLFTQFIGFHEKEQIV